MGANVYAAARYGTKGIGLTSEERMDMPVLFVGKKQSLMFGTAVNARSAERWSMCTMRAAFASIAGRARWLIVTRASTHSYARGIAVAAAR